jgi:hypothetical protein
MPHKSCCCEAAARQLAASTMTAKLLQVCQYGKQGQLASFENFKPILALLSAV